MRGDDPALVAQAARTLLAALVGDRDPTLVVEEHGGSSIEELDVGAVVDACTTPPFLVDRRVVVVRDAGRLGAADAARLAAYLADPLPVLRAGAGGRGRHRPPVPGEGGRGDGRGRRHRRRDGSGPQELAGRAAPEAARCG